jgi:predicted O-methyltransferase YrrM
MFSRLLSTTSLMLKHGPRTVLLAREAKRRGAAQKKGELRPLISRLRTRRLRTVVEIGTFKGGTLWLWCQLAEPDALVVSIDLPGGEFGGGYDAAEAEQIRSYARGKQELILIRGDSHAIRTRDELTTALGERGVDFLFIDGDHTYEGVKQDYEMYAPLVRNGGMIVFHDILPQSVDDRCGVDKLWEELKGHSDERLEEIVDTDTDPSERVWGGIGAMTVIDRSPAAA